MRFQNNGQVNPLGSNIAVGRVVACCLAAMIVGASGCQGGKLWKPQLPTITLPKLAWGKNLNFGNNNPTDKNITPPSQHFQPESLDRGSDRYADNSSDRENPRDRSIPRSPYSVDTPADSLASRGSSFGNTSTGNNRFGSENLARSADLPSGGSIDSARGSEIGRIPGGSLGRSTQRSPVSNAGFGTTAFGSTSVASNPAGSSSGFPGSAANAGNPTGFGSTGTLGLQSLPAAPNAFGSGSSGRSTASRFPATGQRSASPFPSTIQNPAAPVNRQVSGALPAAPMSSSLFPAANNGLTNSTNNGNNALQPVANPAALPMKRMLKPYRPGSTGNSPGLSTVPASSGLPSYPATSHGSFSVRPVRRPNYPQSSLPAPQRRAATPSAYSSPVGSAKPKGMICDGERCYIPK